MRRVTLGGLTLVAALLVSAAPALAEDSFSGSCKNIQGSATFDTPLSNTASDNTYHFAGTGTCSGKLDGADVTDTPISAQVDGAFNGSCTSSKSTAPGPGRLVFTKGTDTTADDVTITFTMQFTGTASEVDFTLTGTLAGSTTGHATFLTQRTPPDIAVNCAGGGNSELPFDATANQGSLSSGTPKPTQQTAPQQPPSSGGGGGSPAEGNEASRPAKSSTAPSIDVPAQTWGDVLAHGLRAVCHGDARSNCVVKARLSKRAGKKYKLTGTVAGGRATIPAGADSADVVVRLTGAARRKLRRQAAVALTLVATIGGKQVTKTVTLRR